MAKKPSPKRSRKPARIQDLSPTSERAKKVKAGALLLSTQFSVTAADGNGQPPNRLTK